MKTFRIVLAFAVLCSAPLGATWPQENADKITLELKKTIPDWSLEDTQRILKEAETTGRYQRNVSTDDGTVAVEIDGEKFLLNGKDISLMLGRTIQRFDTAAAAEEIPLEDLGLDDASAEIRALRTGKTGLSILLTISIILNVFLFTKYIGLPVGWKPGRSRKAGGQGDA